MTWGTVLLEGLFPISVYFRWTRIPITLAVMGLHLGIAFCIPGVTLFTLSMVVGAFMYLPTCCYSTLTLRALLQSIVAWPRFYVRRIARSGCLVARASHRTS